MPYGNGEHAMLTQIVEVLALFTMTHRELGVSDVARMLGRRKSTVSGWLSAMHRAGLLDRANSSGPYRLGIRLAAFGELARLSTPIQRVALPLIEQLTRRTRETSSLNVLVGSEVVNSSVAESPQPIRSAGGLGVPMPIHATAAGKVLVAWRSPEEIRTLLPFRLEQFTPTTIKDVDSLLEQLAVIREQGYSIAAGEMASDLFALSAPVRDSSGAVVAAISIAAPVSRVSQIQTVSFVNEVTATADAVSAALGYQHGLFSTATA
jgi:DNA-binding IclR family transcriptional regulator